MNFMDLKRLIKVTGKSALEILEIVEHAKRIINDGSEESSSDKDNEALSQER